MISGTKNSRNTYLQTSIHKAGYGLNTRNTKVYETIREKKQGKWITWRCGGEDEEWREWSLVFMDEGEERQDWGDVRKIYKYKFVCRGWGDDERIYRERGYMYVCICMYLLQEGSGRTRVRFTTQRGMEVMVRKGGERESVGCCPNTIK